jgi:pimeloyl-ACP methyl ester carboxylesterase
MKLSKLLTRILGGTLWLLAVTLSLTSASAQTSTAQPIKNVLLVHGAWADGSSWAKVIPRLTAAGLNVVAVQIPLTSLADDVAATERAIALANGPVLLVGHSYGGAVITEAGNDPKVVGLVFVSAFAPDTGESSLSLATANPTPGGAELRESNGFFKLTTTGIFDDFAQDLSIIERTILSVTQVPTAGSALGAPATSPAWRNKPTWFVVAANDRTVSPQLEAMEAKRMNATTITVSTSHVAMLAAPEKVSDFIRLAVDQLGDK